MNLSKQMQELLAYEIDFSLQRMKESNDASAKLYFFSGVYAGAFRIMNIEYDAELAFIHHVLQASHQMIDGKITRLQQGLDRHIALPENFFDRLEAALEEMLSKIRQGEDTYPVLQTIFNLAYSTTGNGYYLYLKGVLPV